MLNTRPHAVIKTQEHRQREMSSIPVLLQSRNSENSRRMQDKRGNADVCRVEKHMTANDGI